MKKIFVGLGILLLFVVGGIVGILMDEIFFGAKRSGEYREYPFEAPVAGEKAKSASFLDTFTEEAGIERKVIVESYLDLEVKNFETANTKIIQIVKTSGGYISNSSMSVSPTGKKRGYIVARIPQKNFDSVLSQIEGVGDVKNKSISGRDVTMEYIDLEARLKNAIEQEKRYLEILKMAKTVDEVLAVEAQLSGIRAQIESLQGQMNYLENRVDYATLQINLYEPEETVYKHSWRIVEAIHKAIEGFMKSVRGFIIFVGYFLPFVIIFGIGFLLYRKLKAFF